jgi:hypothetical protein
MPGFQPFEATNAPDTCKWCGRKLPRPHYIKREHGPLPTRCGHCRSQNITHSGGVQTYCRDCFEYTARPWVIVSRTPAHAKPGGYGDGHFCGLGCGYQFGRVLADGGRSLRPVQVVAEGSDG